VVFERKIKRLGAELSERGVSGKSGVVFAAAQQTQSLP
jgi:hypothetical protein